MGKTKNWAIFLMIVTTFLTSIAQIFLKKGANVLQFNFFSLITNYNLIIGIILYGLAAVLLIIALRGGELSVLYPMISTSYIWVALLASYFFGELFSITKIIGIIAIIIGVTFIGIGSRKSEVAAT
ncbi:hypothetical protein HZA96_04530 [Candidatus Woesearchaeota archaeon]|nr:hypothetical protein [Candidatus Woesearchaeota archaeon]